MINKSILVGRLTKDPELRKTPNNISVVNFTVACDRYGEGADFIPCVCYKQSADYLAKYGKKGDVVAIDGHITTGSYEGRNGKVYTVEVTADRVALPLPTSPKRKRTNCTITSGPTFSCSGTPYLTTDMVKKK